MSKFFEVLFRGENERTLQLWRPEGSVFECTHMEAQQRHDELVKAGEAQSAIDGVVPFVIEVRRVQIGAKKLSVVKPSGRMTKRRRREFTRIDTMLLSQVDGPNDVVQSGPWATN